MAGPRSATYDSSAMAAVATLASKAVTVTPGGEAVSEVRIRNSGTVVDQFTLEVLGDASAWAIVEPAVIPLFPGAEAVARIRFKPPKDQSLQGARPPGRPADHHRRRDDAAGRTDPAVAASRPHRAGGAGTAAGAALVRLAQAEHPERRNRGPRAPGIRAAITGQHT